MKTGCEKPISRSKLRLWLGIKYFTFKRYLTWYSGKYKFAKRTDIALPNTVFKHQTPLFRKLKNVDMHLQYNKVVNLKIALKKLDGIIINPGEVFSYWKSIGKPSKRKGYLEGMILNNGSVISAIGGGLCQFSNLIFWITAHTPLTIIERHRHGFDVFPDSNRTQPFGSGATCFYNYRDLMIRNDTGMKFRLKIKITETELIGKWTCDKSLDYSCFIYEKEHIMQPEYWGGYSRHNVLYKKKLDQEGNVIEDEYFIENHAIMMYSPFLENKNQGEK